MFHRALMGRKDAGFTLIELLVVMVIISILACLAIPLFAGLRERAGLTALKYDLRNAATFAEAYAVDNNGSYSAFDLSTTSRFKKSASTAVIAQVDLKTNASRFCIEGTTNAAVTWSFDSTRAVQLAAGTCA